jgi:hypothetical protein
MSTIISRLRNEIETQNIDLNYRVSGSLRRSIAAKIGTNEKLIQKYLAKIRRENKMDSFMVITKEDPKSPFTGFCKDNGLIRASLHQTAACYKIARFIPRKLPFGGEGLLIGTMGPFFAYSKNLFPNTNTLVDDEYYLANTLQTQTDNLTIVNGNAVNETKAVTKSLMWKGLLTKRHAKVTVQPVNGKTYKTCVEEVVLNEPNGQVIVILLTSGTWKGCKLSEKKYEFDVNFRDPSIELSSKHPNLYIFTIAVNGKYKFDPVFVHNGNESFI